MGNMRRFCSLSFTVTAFAVASFGQGQSGALQATNPFDLTKAREAVGDSLPTVKSVAELEKRALDAFVANDCKTAAPLLNSYAKQANHLSNLIRIGLDPFYDASAEEKRNFRAGVSSLIPYEKLVNDYLTKRNRAMVMEAECTAKTDPKAAASMFFAALDLINIDDLEWWIRARKGLYSILGVD